MYLEGDIRAKTLQFLIDTRAQASLLDYEFWQENWNEHTDALKEYRESFTLQMGHEWMLKVYGTQLVHLEIWL